MFHRNVRSNAYTQRQGNCSRRWGVRLSLLEVRRFHLLVNKADQAADTVHAGPVGELSKISNDLVAHFADVFWDRDIMCMCQKGEHRQAEYGYSGNYRHGMNTRLLSFRTEWHVSKQDMDSAFIARDEA